jgi:pumilio RNA-binding family
MGKPHARSQIIRNFTGTVVKMSQHKYASNVVEKCLEHGDTPERELLIEEIIGQSEDNDNLLVPYFCLLLLLLSFFLSVIKLERIY